MRATMILVVEAMGSRLSGFLPARYSPVSVSTSVQAAAFNCGASGALCWAAAPFPAEDTVIMTSTVATSAATVLARAAPRRSFTAPRSGKHRPLGVWSCVCYDNAAEGSPRYFARGGRALPASGRGLRARRGYVAPPAGYI